MNLRSLSLFALLNLPLAAVPPLTSAAPPLRASWRAAAPRRLHFFRIAAAPANFAAAARLGSNPFLIPPPAAHAAAPAAFPRIAPTFAPGRLVRRLVAAPPIRSGWAQLHAPAASDERGHGFPTRWLAAAGVAIAVIGTAVMITGWH